jgi:BolA protein
MSMDQQIEQKLSQAFAPDGLQVVNDSHRHAGHAGSPGTGESHFSVTMVSAAFDGLSRVERQRRVYAVLADELAGPVHALSLSLKTPGEAG